MSENVIEQQIEALGRKEDLLDSGTIDNDSALWADGRAYGLHEAAKQLQAATDPRQFMPRLDEWPGWANEIVVMMVNFRGHGIGWDLTASFLDAGGTQEGGLFDLNLPPGIDPRIKISREQMKAWERSHGGS